LRSQADQKKTPQPKGVRGFLFNGAGRETRTLFQKPDKHLICKQISV
jgi:hypothetical protein